MRRIAAIVGGLALAAALAACSGEGYGRGDRSEQGGQKQAGQDPLGRGQSALGQSGVKIPGATDLARARAILEELRRRAAQMNRPQSERDYLDRLLKSF